MATFGGKYETEKNKQVLKQQSLITCLETVKRIKL